MLICGALITTVVALATYLSIYRRAQDHSRSAAYALLLVAGFAAIGFIAVVHLRAEHWRLYGIVQTPEGAGLRGKLALARGISGSAAFVATLVAAYAASRKVLWAAVAVVVFLVVDGVFAFALSSARAGGLLG